MGRKKHDLFPKHSMAFVFGFLDFFVFESTWGEEALGVGPMP
jgi:hypothetical protein